MATGAIEMREGGSKAHARGRGRSQEAGECGAPIAGERSQGPPEGGILARAGGPAWGHAPSERRRLENMGDEGARGGEQAQPVEHQGLDRLPGGHHPPCRVLRGGLLKDLGEAAVCQQARD
jgi:hypothetical protein